MKKPISSMCVILIQWILIVSSLRVWLILSAFFLAPFSMFFWCCHFSTVAYVFFTFVFFPICILGFFFSLWQLTCTWRWVVVHGPRERVDLPFDHIPNTDSKMCVYWVACNANSTIATTFWAVFCVLKPIKHTYNLSTIIYVLVLDVCELVFFSTLVRLALFVHLQHCTVRIHTNLVWRI